MHVLTLLLQVGCNLWLFSTVTLRQKEGMGASAHALYHSPNNTPLDLSAKYDLLIPDHTIIVEVDESLFSL